MLDGTFPPGEPLLRTKSCGTVRREPRVDSRCAAHAGDDWLLETRHGQGTFPHELSVDRLVAPLASVMAYGQICKMSFWMCAGCSSLPSRASRPAR